MPAAAFGQRFDNAATLYKPLKNPYVDDYVIRTRGLGKIKLISSKNGLRQLYQSLKKGAMVCLLFDQNAGRDGLPCAVFWENCFDLFRPCRFCLENGLRHCAGLYDQRAGLQAQPHDFGEQFPLIQTGDMESDIIANTRQYNAFIEELVRRHPEQWFGWLHRRWKLPRAFAGNDTAGE